MIFGSVCSGLEAASEAWIPLGWEPAWYSEIEPFPCAVLKHRHPNVPNLGDMRRIHEKKAFRERPIDLLVGGTPCQSFSVAGLRKGLADPRGNLALVFLSILNRARPQWVVWENVPGVLSSWSDEAGSFVSDDAEKAEKGFQTNDFDTFTAALRELGYGVAYRILDAQFVGVPQRRRRIFVVGYLGDWRRAAAVLFESHSLSWDSPPSRKAGQGSTACFTTSPDGSGRPDNATPTIDARAKDGPRRNQGGTIIAQTLMGRSNDACDPTFQTYVTPPLKAEGFDASEDGTGRGTPIVPIQGVQSVRDKKQNGIGIGEGSDPMFTLTGRDQHAVFDMRGNGDGNISPTLSRSAAGDRPNDYAPMIFSSKDYGADAGETSPTLRAGGHDKSHANAGVPPAVAIGWSEELTASRELAGTIQRGGEGGRHEGVMTPNMTVRRLTPRECERLQGFKDDYTLIPYGGGRPAADGPRYKAIGNSMAIPVMAWIGKRISIVDKL